jgi:hypothetical protein
MKRSLVVWLALWPAMCQGQQGSWEYPPVLFGDATHTPIEAVNLVHVFDYDTTYPTTGTCKVLALTHEGTKTCVAGKSRLWTSPAALGPLPGIVALQPSATTGSGMGGR